MRLRLRGALPVLVTVLAAGCSGVGTPPALPAVVIHTAPPRVRVRGTAARLLAEAHARHRRGIECGTQYATETGEIAREGSAALPDLVAAIASDTNSDEAVFVFYMMGDQALEALPELLEPSNSAGGGWLEMGVSPPPQEDWPPCPAATEENWREAVEAVVLLNQELRKAVRDFPPDRLDEPLVPDVPYTAYTQFIGVTQHNLYHAGQISLLKRALARA